MVITSKTIGIGAVVVLVILAIIYFAWLRPEPVTPEPKPEPTEPIVEVPPKPETLEEAVKILNTSELLIAFLNEYFTIEDKDSLIALAPDEFYKRESGGAQDFAVFAAHVFRQNRFEAGIIRFDYQSDGKERTHFVTSFRDKDKPGYITATEAAVQLIHHGWSFSDLIKSEERRLEVKALRYCYFPSDFLIVDLSEPLPGYDWVEVK